MGLRNRLVSLASLLAAAMVVAACSASATPASSVLGASATPSGMAMDSITIGSTNDATLGAYLTGENGMTLYVFTADSSGKSSCDASCAVNWPPLVLASGATITGPTGATGTFSLITRSDGTMQAAYNGMPLYYYAGDSAAGDTTGQGVAGKWFVAPLSGSLGSPAAMSEAPSAMASEAPAPSQSGY